MDELMRDGASGVEEPAAGVRRVFGRYGGDRRGPVLLVVGALHGNEPAGLMAGRRVLRRLEEARPDLRGEVVFLAGNLAALAADRRFIESDLNRMWLPERVATLESLRGDDDLGPEDRELRGLWLEIRARIEAAEDGAFLIDLHTSSAHGCPFLTVGDTLRNRAFAKHFPLPLILGLEEQIDGPLLEFLNNLGMVTVGVEAGQHRASSAIDHMESALWVGLVAAGMLDPADAPDLADHRTRLAEAARGVPRVIEVRHRHPIRPGDGFRMEPGFANFQRVARGQTLAHDDEGPIDARERGRVLLPLYQGQGDDGFFLARDVSPFWLRVSEVLRRAGAWRWIRHVPGVRPHARIPDALAVDTRIARWFPLEVFHLLGFRKLRRRGDLLIVARRRHDLRPPDRYV